LDAALLAADVADIKKNGLGIANGTGVVLGTLCTAAPLVTGCGAADEAVEGGIRALGGMARSLRAAARGRAVHAEFATSMRAAGHFAEFAVKGGRIDGLMVDAAKKTLHVIELKPNNARAIRRGEEQLRRYVRELQNMDQFKGFRITTEVRTYN
jgi:hypothetical protein